MSIPSSTLQLRDYQVEGVSFLLQSESALLADEMGLGKTAQVIIALKLFFSRGLGSRALVVVPRSLRKNWQYEFSKWAPAFNVKAVSGPSGNRQAFYLLPYPIVLVTYEQIRNDASSLRTDEQFDVVILDEAQRIKNIRSKTSLACSIIPRKRAWALTGTPVENSIDDLISIYSFVAPGLLNRGMDRETIQRLTGNLFLRRRKNDVAPEMPEIFSQELELELGGRQLAAYQEMWSHRTLALSQKKVTEMHLLAVITKLKQLCNYDIASKESVKFEALQLIVENLSRKKDKLLVISQYVETLKWLKSQLEKTINVEIYHGSQSDFEREKNLNQFRNAQGPRVLLMSLRAGGVGLNIPEATTVVLYDRWWNPASEQQAINRAHRLGRNEPLQVVKFLIVDTIEEKIRDILVEKERLFENLVENIDEPNVSYISKEEMWKILETRPK